MKWIDRADARFGHLAIPHLIQAIAVLSGMVFFFFKLDPKYFSILELYPERVMNGEVWRLVTYIFVPTICSFLLPLPDWVNAAFYVMFMFWMGKGLEQVWGNLKINLYCLLTMAGITISAFYFGTLFSHFMLVQALFFAFARYFPEEVITLFFVLPVKVKWLAWADAAWLMWMSLHNGSSFIMALVAALIAYFLFFGREIFNETRARQEVAVRRRRFVADARQPDDEALHRCAVCGTTEFDSPDMEFRVSRDGEEYCAEHLPKPAAAAEQLPG